MTKKLFLIFIIGIIGIASFFRLYRLAVNPPSLNWDEVAFGYNAYSILKTGKDEYGKQFPLYFRSLDDYKLPVQTYLVAGSISVFGYNDFAVRLPSSVAGIITVFLLILLATEFFGKRWVGVVTGLLAAVAPWNVQYSRMAAESNVGYMFLVGGILFFLWGIRKKQWYLIVSVFSFILAMFSYLSLRIITPIIGTGMVMLYWKNLPKKKDFFIAAGIVVFVAMFLLKETLTSGIHIRFTGTNIFQMYEPYKKAQDEMFYDATLGINIPRRIFHDTKLTTTIPLVMRGYLTHFSPDFLFFDLEQKHHYTPLVGLLYWWTIPFLLAGFVFLWKYKSRVVWTVMLLLFVVPIPAAFTWDIPNAIRTLAMTGPIHLITALGIVTSFELFKGKRNWFLVAGAAIVLMFFLFSFHFYHQYMIHLPEERSDQWVYGRKEMTEYLEKEKGNYKKIILSTNLEWPYMFMLYYSKYDPQKYLSQGGTVSGGWGEEKNKYDNYEFRSFVLDKEEHEGILFVGKPKDFPKEITPNKVIPYLDGTPAMYFVTR